MSDIESALPEQTFYGQHQDQLHRLFEITGVPEKVHRDLPAIVEATQPWVKGDHSRPEHRFKFEDPESSELHEIYGILGLRDAHELPPDIYDHTILLGALHRGNNRRLEFMNKGLTHGTTITNDITLLGGERRVYPEVELDEIEDNLHTLRNVDESWLQRLRSSGIESWWETDLLRLAAGVRLGLLAVVGTEQEPFDATYRPHLQTFSWRNMPLALMHTKAVARQGEPRHTTEACIRDWLATAQPEANARVAFFGANPHLTRMGRSAQAVLRAEGRADIELVVAGPASADYLGHGHYLGEVARQLYEDQRLLEA
jgi:hypothetical protein